MMITSTNRQKEKRQEGGVRERERERERAPEEEKSSCSKHFILWFSWLFFPYVPSAIKVPASHLLLLLVWFQNSSIVPNSSCCKYYLKKNVWQRITGSFLPVRGSNFLFEVIAATARIRSKAMKMPCIDRMAPNTAVNARCCCISECSPLSWVQTKNVF